MREPELCIYCQQPVEGSFAHRGKASHETCPTAEYIKAECDKIHAERGQQVDEERW